MSSEQKTEVLSGGILTVLPVCTQQIIYLDFDGELTSYNGEILTVSSVTVEDSGLTEERIAQITQALNERFAGQNVLFVSDQSDLSDQSGYSTIYIGKTSSFEPYGSFAGLAETVDSGNKIHNDNAFVMLDSLSSNERIADVIAHEAGHLLGTLDHGGEGLQKYASSYYVASGVTSTGITLKSNDYMYVYDGGTADSIVISNGGQLYVSSGGTADNIITNIGGRLYVSSGGRVNDLTVNSMGTYNSGSVYVSKGATASNVIVSSYGKMYVDGVLTGDIDLDSYFVYISGATILLDLTQQQDPSVPVMNSYTGQGRDSASYFVRVSSTQAQGKYALIGNASGFLANKTITVSYSDRSWSAITTFSINNMAVCYYTGNCYSLNVNSSNQLELRIAKVNWSIDQNGKLVLGSEPDLTYYYNTVSSDYTGDWTAYCNPITPADSPYYCKAVDSSGKTVATRTISILMNRSLNSRGGAFPQYTSIPQSLANYYFYGNSATQLGGAVYLNNQCQQVTSAVFRNNSATNGGAVYGCSYNNILDNVEFTSNRARQGGAIYNVGTMDLYNAVFTSNTLLGSTYDYRGGAIYNGNQNGFATLSLAGAVFSGNSARIGGAIYNTSRGSVIVGEGGISLLTQTDTFANEGSINWYLVNATADQNNYSISNWALVQNSGTLSITVGPSTELGEYILAGGAASFSSSVSLYYRETTSDSPVSAGALEVNGGGIQMSDITYSLELENSTLKLCAEKHTDSNTQLYSSGTLVSQGKVLSGQILTGGFSMYVSSGGTAKDTVASALGRLYVSDGGIADDTMIRSGGSVIVSSGGTVNNAVVDSIGHLIVSDGGIANSTTLSGYMNGGYGMTVSGGTATDTMVSSGGSMIVSGGGVVYNTTVNSGGCLDVFSGGTANNTTVNSGVLLCIVCTANNTTVNSGGCLNVFSCGIANSTTVNSGGCFGVLSGGTATNIVVSSGAWLAFDVASNTYIQGISGGSLFQMQNACISGYTVNSGGLYICSGGTAIGTTVNSCGTLDISSGGKITGGLQIENGAVVSAYAGAIIDFTVAKQASSSTALINDWSRISGCNDASYTITVSTTQAVGNYILADGASAFSKSVTVKNTDGDTLGTIAVGGTVESGTTAYTLDQNGSVLSLDVVYVPHDEVKLYSSGTIVSSATVMTGKILTGGFSMYVSSGGTAKDTVASALGRLYVSDGGIADDIIICSGGSVIVSSGGTACSTTVNSKGRLNVVSGGTAVSVKENGGYVMSANGASVTFESNCISGLELSITTATIHSGTTAIDTVINSGGRAEVFNGGKMDSTSLTNAGIFVYSGGSADNTSVNSAAGLVLSRGGTANNTVVNSLGGMYVSYGASAVGTIVNYGGNVYVSNGGTIHETTLNSSGGINISSGGSADSTTVNSGGCAYVYEGGYAANTILNSSGYLGVSLSGTVSNITVNSDGCLCVSSGGTATGAILNAGGSMSVSNGGSALYVKENGGYVDAVSGFNFITFDSNSFSGLMLNTRATVHSGTTANSTTVESGGELQIYSGGSASSTSVNLGGSLYVSDGGTALSIRENGGYVYVGENNNVTFESNCISGFVLNTYATVHSGTTANNTTVDSGGSLYVCSGGIVNNTAVNSSGGVCIYSGGILKGTVQIESGANVSVNTGATIDFTVAEQVDSSTALINRNF